MDGNITVGSNGSGSLRHPLLAGAILYGTQASFSLIANLLVIFLLTYRRHLLCNPHYRCILSLAITDILTSVSVIFSPRFTLGEKFYNPKAQNYLAREFYCRLLWNKYLPFALGVTSLYTCAVLSFERWLAVKRSIFYKSRFKIRHMNVLIIASWIAGFVSEVPVIVFVEAVYDQPTESCRYTTAQNKIQTVSFSTGLFVVKVVIPFALATLAYIDVFRGIKASLRFAASARAQNINGIKKLKKVTKVAAISTFVLAVCWLPCSVSFYYSLLIYEPLNDQQNPFVLFVTLLAFANSCINPFIYVFSNPELRNSLRDVFH